MKIIKIKQDSTIVGFVGLKLSDFNVFGVFAMNFTIRKFTPKKKPSYAGRLLRKKFVTKKRFELSQAFAHYHLKVACLPISPPRHVIGFTKIEK